MQPAMTSPNDLVLLTGATGYLGYLILISALKAGHRVRIAVRSPSKLQKVLNAPSIKALNLTPDQLTSTVVPEIGAPGAYNDAVKGATHIIHAASPIPTFGGPNPPAKDDYEAHFVTPAVTGTLAMLHAAAAELGVKRIVLTSSAVAIAPFEYFAGKGDPHRVFTAADRIPFAPGPWESEFEAYSAGKAKALNAAEAFVAEEKPGFDLVPVIPGWIFGRDELVTTKEGLRAESTNSVLLALLMGLRNEMPYNGHMALGSDVARVHVAALDGKVRGNRAFLASVDAQWQDALKVVERYPEAVEEGKLSLQGVQGTLEIPMSSAETEEVLGFKFQPFETMVAEVVEQWLELCA
ncbi:hypothetical protein MMC10_010098 [Thelotrema lepadinum]|nr:hypothetical protein [Thelotrema lepadinum]